tara:strand:- start:2107 stop:2364 length:258 start_codon:yes stop_codon:yes gene_type:complete
MISMWFRLLAEGGLGRFWCDRRRRLPTSLGVERIDLDVRRDNPKVLNFWETQDFVIGHYELSQYRDPEKGIGFRGALSSDFADEE